MAVYVIVAVLALATTESSPATASPPAAKWQMTGEYPLIAGRWAEAEKKDIFVTIQQDGNKLVINCTYQKKGIEVRWRADGTISKDGELTANLVHITPKGYKSQKRTGKLDPDGRTIRGHATWDNGAHDFVWTRKAMSTATPPKPKAGVTPGFDPLPEEGKSTKMARWNVSADAQVDRAQLDTLKSTLGELNAIFPSKRLPVIQRVPIQVHGDGNSQKQKFGKRVTGFYQPSPVVITNGVAKSTGVGKVHILSSRDCGNKILLVHELSHAAMYLTIGDDNVRVKKAYQEIVKKQLYEKDCFLMTNHEEYFAEMSVVYLYGLHYFPHDRETLRKHDPTTFKLMEDFWGPPSDTINKR